MPPKHFTRKKKITISKTNSVASPKGGRKPGTVQKLVTSSEIKRIFELVCTTAPKYPHLKVSGPTLYRHIADLKVTHFD